MLTEKRHEIILNLLQQKEIVSIQELVALMGASESTVRRDLSQLEQMNKLKRIHGGATIINENKKELTVLEKSSKHLKEKQMIGAFAAKLIEDGECIYIDAGTSTLQMIDYITVKNITVVTNGITHIEPLMKKEIKTYLVGGYVKGITSALVGQMAVDSLRKYRFDKSFIGSNGVHPDFGYTTPDPEEAAVKQLALSLGQKAFVLADRSKFNQVAFAEFGKLKEATIITDFNDEHLLEDFKKKTKIEVVT